MRREREKLDELKLKRKGRRVRNSNDMDLRGLNAEI